MKDKEELNDALIKLKAEVSKLRSKDSATAKVLDEEKKKSQEMVIIHSTSNFTSL